MALQLAQAYWHDNSFSNDLGQIQLEVRAKERTDAVSRGRPKPRTPGEFSVVVNALLERIFETEDVVALCFCRGR